MKKTLFLFMAIVAFVLVANAAFANNPILPLFVSGANQASDEDREYLIDRVGGVIGQIDVGDSLRGSINFNTLNSAAANVGGTTPNNEVSGVFQVLVTGKVNLGTVATPIWQFTFGVDPAFVGSNVGGHIVEPGGIILLFEDPTPDYAGDFNDPAPSTPPLPPDDGTVSSPSPADVSVGPYVTEEAFLALAADGAWRWTLGFLGLPGEGAFGLQIPGAQDNVLNGFNFTSGTAFSNANLSLNLIAFDPAWASVLINRVTPSVFGGTVDFAVSQQIRGVSDLNTPFETSSNTNISFNAVPEPATLLLLGAGLVGLAAAARRRMKE